MTNPPVSAERRARRKAVQRRATQKEQGKRLELKTKGACVLCRRPVHSRDTGHPEQSVEASQYGSFSCSLEGNELNAESSVLHRDALMTT